MIGRLAALILLSKLCLIQTAEVPEKITLTVVEAGGNVALKCPISSQEGRFFHWYKLPLGYKVQTVASGTVTTQTLRGQFNNARFKLTEENAHYSLSIRNVKKDDEGTYFCQNGTAFSFNFIDSIFLAVNDRNQQKSVEVKQSPETASVQPGNLMTLQCSLQTRNGESSSQCPGERSVYWFRTGSGQSHPAIIYTQTNSSDNQEGRSCIYSLSKLYNTSDDGTYYCAVVTCGEILFGEGTKVKTRSDLDPVVLVLGVVLVGCVAAITVLIFYVNRRRVCEHCKGAKSASHYPGHDESTVDQSTDLDGDTEAVNYAALDFSSRKVKRVKKKRESPEECVYSAVRADCQSQQRPLGSQSNFSRSIKP